MQLVLSSLVLAIASQLILAQNPALPTGLTVVDSKVNIEVKISYKEIDICEQTSGVKSYSGFVSIPGSLLSDVGGYNANLYFAYFEARNDASTAPLGIYLAGGPGLSSTYSALSSESGPCYVNMDGTDTINNTWSFNNYANMLYIDQPVQTGFSYNEIVNATFNFLEGGLITPLDSDSSAVPTSNETFGYGTFASPEFSNAANTTVQDAKLLWYFLEHWLSSFPGYDTQSNKVSVWGNSYGGYWAPEIAVQLSRNLQNMSSEHPLEHKNLTVDALGLTNACVDLIPSIAGYPECAYNNTYGVRFGNESLYEEAMYNATKPDGCLDLVAACRALGLEGDPDFTGRNTTVNEICMEAFAFCESNVIQSFPELNQQSAFDVAISLEDQCDYWIPVQLYLNNATTQQALGVPLNFTYQSPVVQSNFGVPTAYSSVRPLNASSGDAVRQGGLSNIEYLLANNVKVAFIFGDRDYRCPWTGGEATALAANWTHQLDFVNAGYEEMQGIQTPIAEGGLPAVVKQYGSFSFSRVLGSGHATSAYAPETVYKIFDRTLRGVDVVAGSQPVDAGYQTQGPKDSWGWRNTLPATPPTQCIVEGLFLPPNPFPEFSAGSG